MSSEAQQLNLVCACMLQRNTVWEAARIEVEQRRRTEAEDSLREQIDKGTLKDRAVDMVADDVQHRTDYFR